MCKRPILEFYIAGITRAAKTREIRLSLDQTKISQRLQYYIFATHK